MRREAVVLIICVAAAGCAPESAHAPAAQVIDTESVAGQFRVRMQVTPENPWLSDQVRLTVTAEFDADYEVVLPNPEVLAGDFVVHPPVSSEVNPQKGRKTASVTFRLEPRRPGPVVLESLVCRFKHDTNRSDTRSVSTEPIEIRVSTRIQSKTPQLRELAQQKGPIELARNLNPLFTFNLAALAALVVAVVGWRVVRKLQEPKARAPALAPAEIARRDLGELRGIELWKTDPKQFFIELTAIVRRYVEATIGVRAPEQTTEEFLSEIHSRNVYEAEERDRFREFLEAADLVKYAGHQPTETDVDFATRCAEEFVVDAEPEPETVPS